LPSCKIALKAACPLPETYPRQLVTWGDHLRKKRLDQKLFQKDVAKILRTNVTTIYNWEKNYTTPELVFMPRIIKFLGYAPYFSSCRNLGEKIVRYREYLGLSQEALARHLGIGPGILKRWEKNESKQKDKQLCNLNHFFYFYAKGSCS
jgi:transcriptional regulator with XRE-family HTH domain